MCYHWQNHHLANKKLFMVFGYKPYSWMYLKTMFNDMLKQDNNILLLSNEIFSNMNNRLKKDLSIKS